MIPRETFEQALPFAQKLADRSIELGVAGGSPLQDLLEHCNPYGLHANGGSLENIDLDSAIQFLVTEASFAGSDGVVAHSKVMDDIAELAKATVLKSLDFTRNVVVPEINELEDKIDQAIRGVMARRTDPFTIYRVETPALLRNSSLAEMVEKYSDTQAALFKVTKIAEMSAGDVAELLNTGASGFDADVKDMVGDGKSYNWFLEHAARFLSGHEQFDSIPTPAMPLLFVVARALYDNPPVGCVMSLSDYNVYVSLLVAQTGRASYNAIESSSSDRRMVRLYTGAPTRASGGSESGMIYVNADVYGDLMEKGLTPEMLFGNEYNGRNLSASQLLENKEDLLATYQRQKAYNDRQKQLEEFNIIKDVIQNALEESIQNRSAESLVADRSVYRAVLKEAMKGVEPSRMKDLGPLLRDLVCAVFYRHTDSIRYLRLIDEIGEGLDEETKVREVALMATIEYISIWVARQYLV